MNKKLFFIFVYSCFAVIDNVMYCQSNEKEESIKVSRRKKRLSRKVCKTPDVILNDQEARTINNLETICKPQFTVVNQHQPRTDREKQLCLFVQQLDFSKGGITSFFQTTFNQKEYGQSFLPHNFSHFEQFMHYGVATEQPYSYFDGIIRLFNTKLKTSSFVNAAAFEKMVTKTVNDFATLYKVESTTMWDDIKKLLWTNFKNQFAFLRQSPMAFFEDISTQLINIIDARVSSPEKLRSVIFRFMDHTVNKLAWSPIDQEKTWDSFMHCADLITLLFHKNIINDEADLNELYWGLIERYCYFLELTGHHFSLQTIDYIKNDFITKKAAWLLLAEQEEGITTKLERISKAILELEAKVRLQEHGIIGDIIPVR